MKDASLELVRILWVLSGSANAGLETISFHLSQWADEGFAGKIVR